MEHRTGTLHPRKSFGGVLIILRKHGAKLLPAKRLGGKSADAIERLPVVPACGRKRVGHAAHPCLAGIHVVDRVGRYVADGASADAIGHVENRAIVGNLSEGSVAETDRVAAVAVIIILVGAVEVPAQAGKSRGIKREGVVELLGVQQPPQEPPLRLGRRQPPLRQ